MVFLLICKLIKNDYDDRMGEKDKKCLKDSKINKDLFVRLICWICVWYSWIGICKLFF